MSADALALFTLRVQYLNEAYQHSFLREKATRSIASSASSFAGTHARRKNSRLGSTKSREQHDAIAIVYEDSAQLSRA